MDSGLPAWLRKCFHDCTALLRKENLMLNSKPSLFGFAHAIQKSFSKFASCLRKDSAHMCKLSLSISVL